MNDDDQLRRCSDKHFFSNDVTAKNIISASWTADLKHTVSVRAYNLTRSDATGLVLVCVYRPYRATLCQRSICHGSVSVSVCVCHKSELYQNG